MNSYKKRIVPCTFCNSKKFNTLFETNPNDSDLHFSPSSQYLDKEKISQCDRCKLVQINPRISKKSLLHLYENSPEKTHHKEKIARVKTFQRIVHIIKHYVPMGSLLDVGAASGFFVSTAQKYGYDTEGIEPNKDSVLWAQKHGITSVKQGSFEKYNGGDYDVITFLDVLEHLYDPYRAINNAYKKTNKGGIIVINIPDWGSLSARLLKKRWWFVTSGHLYYFTDVVLEKMLVSVGYEVLYSKPHIQYFSLVHLLGQVGRYNKSLSKKLVKIAYTCGLNKIIVPYIAGQRLIVAQKNT